MAMHELSNTIPSARLECELLLSHITRRSKAFLYTHPDYELTATEVKHLQEHLERRKSGTPIAYILGVQAFWTVELKVTPDVLIPRPETECLVEKTLELVPPEKVCTIADLGTGSGAIAIALAKERPHWQFTAVDISKNALKIAEDNARNLGISAIQFLQGNWCDNLPHNYYDAIVANPPYIAENDMALESEVRQHEPKEALIAGPSGLEHIEVLINQARNHLKPGGYLLLEHGYQQGQAVQRIFKEKGYINCGVKKDYAGHSRASFGQLDFFT